MGNLVNRKYGSKPSIIDDDWPLIAQIAQQSGICTNMRTRYVYVQTRVGKESVSVGKEVVVVPDIGTINQYKQYRYSTAKQPPVHNDE